MWTLTVNINNVVHNSEHHMIAIDLHSIDSASSEYLAKSLFRPSFIVGERQVNVSPLIMPNRFVNIDI